MPATATAPKTKVRPQTEVETEAEVEVTVDTGLIKILEKWDKSRDLANKSQEQADQNWIQLARYVRDHEISKEQLRYALVNVRGMKESSANVECTRLLRFQKYKEASEMLDRKLEGDPEITVHDLRSTNVKRGEKAEIDPLIACEKKLVTVAGFAIADAEIDIAEFTSLARKAFKVAQAKLEAQAKRNGEEEGGDADTEEEGESEEGEAE